MLKQAWQFKLSRSLVSRESFLRASDLIGLSSFRCFFVFLATFTINFVEFSSESMCAFSLENNSISVFCRPMALEKISNRSKND